MTHFREHFDSNYIGHWDLEGDVVVTIDQIRPGTVEGEKGRKDKKAVAKLKEFQKPWVVNVTNCKTIAGIYGAHVEQWIGKRITLYEDTTRNAEGKTVSCIRVRPTAPKDAPRSRAQEKGPIASASTPEELERAIESQAATINEQHAKRWPVVLEACKRVGLSEERALEVFAKAVPV